MEVEITPEPTPAERAAIECALAKLAPASGRSPWWRDGLEDALDRELDLGPGRVSG
ncbi:MAG: hypothetical protein IT201_04170 [Thermoleophilia bacterium]|nr:hypothetical protein [Thermoleophilia bacterium]